MRSAEIYIFYMNKFLNFLFNIQGEVLQGIDIAISQGVY